MLNFATDGSFRQSSVAQGFGRPPAVPRSLRPLVPQLAERCCLYGARHLIGGLVAKGNERDNSGFLWKVIGRFDTYIGTTNTKAALLATFGTFVFSALVLKWSDFLLGFAGYHKLTVAAGICVAIAAAAAALSTALAFLTVHPFLFSPKNPGKYHSNLFFVHVSEHASGDDYARAVKEIADENQELDLAKQAHSLAKGLTSKMHRLQVATVAAVFSLAAIVAFIVCLLIRAMM